MHQYYLALASRNKKTGPIPVATISKETCPDACPLKAAGCYAEGGPLVIHWTKVTRRETGVDFQQFLRQIRDLPMSIWRYGQAVDLPGTGDTIDADALRDLYRANRHRPVIAFTHKPLTPANLALVREANANGFHINISADTPQEADDAVALGLSAVLVLPDEYGRKPDRKGGFSETLTEYRDRTADLPKLTAGGHRIAICPATYTDTTCQKCGACASPRAGDAIMGFPAHGNRAKAVTRNYHAARAADEVREREPARDRAAA